MRLPESKTRSLWMRTACAALASLPLMGQATVALAQSSGGQLFQPVQNVFQQVLDFMTGSIATTAATVAVCAVGYLSLTGTVPWRWFFAIFFGVALIFGGAQIVQTMSGGLGGA